MEIRKLKFQKKELKRASKAVAFLQYYSSKKSTQNTTIKPRLIILNEVFYFLFFVFKPRLRVRLCDEAKKGKEAKNARKFFPASVVLLH